MYSVYLRIYSSPSHRPCDSRNLALSPLCSLEGLQSLPWVDDAEQVYDVISGQIPQFLTQMKGRLVAPHLIWFDLLLFLSVWIIISDTEIIFFSRGALWIFLEMNIILNYQVKEHIYLPWRHQQWSACCSSELLKSKNIFFRPKIHRFQPQGK